jgi:D-glycero-D-manno-heptose 1,7-bisphosphate phosphatase
MTLRPAVFFDRDGVVNVSPGAGYVLRVADFQLMPGIVEVLSWCKAQGYFTVLVTSQQGVGKGLMRQADLRIDLPASALVGDHDRDIQMARNAGVGFTIRLSSDNTVNDPGDVLVQSIPEVLAALKAWQDSAP